MARYSSLSIERLSTAPDQFVVYVVEFSAPRFAIEILDVYPGSVRLRGGDLCRFGPATRLPAIGSELAYRGIAGCRGNKHVCDCVAERLHRDGPTHHCVSGSDGSDDIRTCLGMDRSLCC